MQTKMPIFQLAHRGSTPNQPPSTDHPLRSCFLTFIPFAIGTHFVAFQLQQILDGHLIFGGTVLAHAAGHLVEFYRDRISSLQRRSVRDQVDPARTSTVEGASSVLG